MHARSVFHLHPLNRCNLQCAHCYSDSGPAQTELLSQEWALAAVEMAAHWGYRALAVSGGEPLLYPYLESVMHQARHLGMTTSLVTNGLRVQSKDDVRYLRDVDLVSVSVDGNEDTHDRLRRRPGAFRAACSAVARLRDSGVNVHLTCGITTDSLDQLESLVKTAICYGACSISFHVASRVGRALGMPLSAFLSRQDETLLFACTALLAAWNRNQIEIRVDLLHRDIVLAKPALLHAGLSPVESALPADVLDVLVMRSDGYLSPLCHGFAPQFGLWQFKPGSHDCYQAIWDRFIAHRYSRLRQLGQALLQKLKDDPERQVLNPNELLAESSWQHANHLSAKPIPVLRQKP